MPAAKAVRSLPVQQPLDGLDKRDVVGRGLAKEARVGLTLLGGMLWMERLFAQARVPGGLQVLEVAPAAMIVARAGHDAREALGQVLSPVDVPGEFLAITRTPTTETAASLDDLPVHLTDEEE